MAKAYEEFDEAGRMKPSPYYDRLIDVMEELVKFILLTRDSAGYRSTVTANGRQPAGRLPAHLGTVTPGRGFYGGSARRWTSIPAAERTG